MRSWVSSRPRRSRDDRDLLRADGVVETELTRRGLTRKLGDRVLFARVGWMAYYRGEQLEPIIGGGDWDEKHEVCNFVDIGGRLYGFARPTGGTISLQRIVPGHRDATLISYARDERGVARDARWIRDAIAFVRSYRGDNVLQRS